MSVPGSWSARELLQVRPGWLLRARPRSRSSCRRCRRCRRSCAANRSGAASAKVWPTPTRLRSRPTTQHGLWSSGVGGRRSENVSACRISGAIVQSAPARHRAGDRQPAPHPPLIRQKRERSQHEKQLAYAQLSACLFASAPAPAAARQPASATPARQPWDQMWSKEVPALVMDHAIPVNPDIWYSRLARHGFVAGNTMTHNMETDALYAVARDRRHSI